MSAQFSRPINNAGTIVGRTSWPRHNEDHPGDDSSSMACCKLAPQVLAEILKTARHPPVSDRRFSGRTSTLLEALLRCPWSADWEPVSVVDISPYGVGILCRGQFPAGSEIEMRLPRHGKDPVCLRCVVARAGPGADDANRIGVEFVELQEDEPLQHPNSNNRNGSDDALASAGRKRS